MRETYHGYHMDIVRESVARTVPTINYPGATAFHNALDENLVAALTKTKTPEQAMADTEKQWKRIARRTGEDKLVERHQGQQGSLADLSIQSPDSPSSPERRGGAPPSSSSHYNPVSDHEPYPSPSNFPLCGHALARSR